MNLRSLLRPDWAQFIIYYSAKQGQIDNTFFYFKTTTKYTAWSIEVQCSKIWYFFILRVAEYTLSFLVLNFLCASTAWNSWTRLIDYLSAIPKFNISNTVELQGKSAYICRFFKDLRTLEIISYVIIVLLTKHRVSVYKCMLYYYIVILYDCCWKIS